MAGLLVLHKWHYESAVSVCLCVCVCLDCVVGETQDGWSASVC